MEAWARWRRVGEVVTIWGVRAMAHWWSCPRGPVPVRRRARGAMLQCLSILALLVAWCGVAWRVQALGAVGLKRGVGLKTRVGRPVAGSATCWYGSTRASYGVPFCIHRLTAETTRMSLFLTRFFSYPPPPSSFLLLPFSFLLPSSSLVARSRSKSSSQFTAIAVNALSSSSSFWGRYDRLGTPKPPPTVTSARRTVIASGACLLPGAASSLGP